MVIPLIFPNVPQGSPIFPRNDQGSPVTSNIGESNLMQIYGNFDGFGANFALFGLVILGRSWVFRPLYPKVRPFKFAGGFHVTHYKLNL